MSLKEGYHLQGEEPEIFVSFIWMYYTDLSHEIIRHTKSRWVFETFVSTSESNSQPYYSGFKIDNRSMSVQFTLKFQITHYPLIPFQTVTSTTIDIRLFVVHNSLLSPCLRNWDCFNRYLLYVLSLRNKILSNSTFFV